MLVNNLGIYVFSEFLTCIDAFVSLKMVNGFFVLFATCLRFAGFEILRWFYSLLQV